MIGPWFDFSRLKGLLPTVVVLAASVAAGCNDNICQNPPVEIGGVTDANAAAGHCGGKNQLYVLKFYTIRQQKVPLRCGRVGTGDSDYGYLHILDRVHGDPMDDATFDAEIQNTLAKGKERPDAGGKWRYSIEYDQTKSVCFKGKWGFRVILARVPVIASDGYAAGVITAYYLDQKPRDWP